MTGRLHDWLYAALASFERGAVDEGENLAFLLGEAFSFERAWEQALIAFDEMTRLAREHYTEPLIMRAVMPLADAQELVVAVPDLDDLIAEVSQETPPTLVVIPPALAVDHRRFEEYRVDLATDLDAAVTYSAARSLDYPHDGIWMRSVTLERT